MLLTNTEKRVIASHNELANLHQIEPGRGHIARLDYAIGKRLHYGAYCASAYFRIGEKMNNTVKLWEVRPNNHGCFGDEVTVEPVSATTGKVVEVRSCSSCWQTGCNGDTSHLPQPGEVVKLPDGQTWETAARQADDGKFYDISFDGYTAVKPSELS